MTIAKWFLDTSVYKFNTSRIFLMYPGRGLPSFPLVKILLLTIMALWLNFIAGETRKKPFGASFDLMLLHCSSEFGIYIKN